MNDTPQLDRWNMTRANRASLARRISERVNKLTAWNFTTEEKQQIYHRWKNQHGTIYIFTDGSKGFVRHGEAKLNAN